MVQRSSTDASIAGNNINNGFLVRQSYIIQKPDPKGTFSFRIPLKHIFGFCDDDEKIVYGFKHQLTLVRKGDNDAIFRNNAADAGKIVLAKLYWYMPRVLPNLQEKLALYKTIESKSSLPVGYRMIQCDSIPVPKTRNFTWRLSVKSAPEKPRWIMVRFRQINLETRNTIHQFSTTVISLTCL